MCSGGANSVAYLLQALNCSFTELVILCLRKSQGQSAPPRNMSIIGRTAPNSSHGSTFLNVLDQEIEGRGYTTHWIHSSATLRIPCKRKGGRARRTGTTIPGAPLVVDCTVVESCTEYSVCREDKCSRLNGEVPYRMHQLEKGG